MLTFINKHIYFVVEARKHVTCITFVKEVDYIAIMVSLILVKISLKFDMKMLALKKPFSFF